MVFMQIERTESADIDWSASANWGEGNPDILNKIERTYSEEELKSAQINLLEICRLLDEPKANDATKTRIEEELRSFVTFIKGTQELEETEMQRCNRIATTLTNINSQRKTPRALQTTNYDMWPEFKLPGNKSVDLQFYFKEPNNPDIVEPTVRIALKENGNCDEQTRAKIEDLKKTNELLAAYYESKNM